MQPTENQINLLSQLGLKVVKDQYSGETRIVTTKNQVPTGTEITDVYYPALYQHVVIQSIEDQMGTGKLLNGVFTKEQWQNGIKEYLMVGLVDDNDYDKVITIGDFNANDPEISAIKFVVDAFKYTKVQITQQEVLQGFTTPAALESFVGLIIKRMADRFNLNFQNERAKIILGTADAKIEMNYDTIVDTTGMSTEEILKLATELVGSLETASADHLSLTDDTYVYSATPDKLEIVKSNIFNASIEMDIEAKLYGPENISVLKVQNEKIDFTKIAGVDLETASAFKLSIIDKRKIKHGLQLDGEGWTVKLPKLQILQELHYWYGYAVLPNYVSILFADAPTIPEGRKGHAPKVYIGKKLYKAVKQTGTLKGVDLKKLQNK